MKIGVLSTCQFSMFSGGLANTTMAIIETMKVLGHDVTLININNNEWYDDVKGLKKEVNIISIQKDSVQSNEQFDLIIELVPFFESETQRRIFSKQNIFLFRKNILIPTIEHSLYPIILQKYNFDGISEVWCFDMFCDSDEVKILETITRKPVYTMPYIWTPSIVECHRNEHNMPLWLQVQDSIPNSSEWNIHVCETNITSSSSCTIPLLIMRQAKLSKFSFSKYKVHNSDQIKNSEFFKDNILRHCQTEDLSGEFVGRQRLTDFVFEPRSCIISHVRFIPFKPMLLDLAWCGIPFIHNSEVLNSIISFERYYYPNNKISVAVEKLQNIDSDFKERKGCFSLENLQEVRKQILERFTCVNSQNLVSYKNRIENLSSKPVTEVKVLESVAEKQKRKTYYLMFCDFWPDFNNSYNFFSLLLNSVPKEFDLICCGESDLPSGVVPNAIVYTMFGETHKKYPDVPKIYFTGENSPPVQEASVKLNLGFNHVDMVSDSYLRFPLWILEIDWFNCDKERISNPKPIPLERCTNVYFDELKRKKKFCAFIVSNPTNSVRNKAFEWINDYKDVDSAGRLFNTMGDILFAGPGGGGGELRKHEFLKDYKFCIAYENSSSQGYVTEKLLHAKAAGCIPIYWGDPKVERDFNTNGFIDARNIHTKEELIAAVKAIDENDAEYIKKYSVPALDAYHVDWARRTMAELANRILKIVTSTPVNVPRFVGATPSKESQTQSQPQSQTQATTVETPLVVTYATRQFLPSLHQWLASFEAQRRMVQDLKARVYLGHDVPESTKETLTKEFAFVEFDCLPTEVPEQFKDIWSGEHYAWKIYIYQKLANTHNGMVFYLDAGGFMCRWPTEYLKIAQGNDICVLSDSQQYNEQWCSEKCKSIMNISEDELAKHQIVGGIMAFRAGSEKAKAFFNEAWKYAQIRDCIVGEKWTGLRNGKPYGHRHDQSILSILSLRHNLAKYNLHTLYCDISLRRTFLDNKFIYVHRGQFKVHEPFMEGIDDCFVINLKRRADRLERLYTNSPELKNKLYEFEAYEGKKLTLTPSISRLFKPHDFMWKKAIMGCALSHLELWYKLATEKPEIQNYLILEDDVKFVKGWQQRWLEALPHLPENYDVIYLGGILPPNRAGFELMKDKINPYFSRVKENNMFGQNPPNRYFHFCAYAYVLSKQGAQKIMATIEAKDGYYTSADHMVCNPVDFMNIYFLDPLVAGCYQDDDPVYANSEFNNFNRIDGFDSDLWNNDERFDKDEALKLSLNEQLNIPKALFEARNSTKLECVKVVKEELKSEIIEVSKNISNGVFKRICVLEEQNIEFSKLYESNWLYELFGRPKLIELQKVKFDMPPPVEKPICLVMKTHIESYKKLFAYYEANNIQYVVLHLSDEHDNDDISFYDNTCCVKVIRNYTRPNLNEKVLVIPLGYHFTLRNGIDNPLAHTPQLPFRSNAWCFFGTNWNNRGALLEPLKNIGNYKCKLFDQWNHPENLSREEYCATLLDSVFVPCIGGNNPETFRLYEALECGCIPIIVNDNPYYNYITKYIPLLNITSWAQVPGLIMQLYNDKPNLQAYRNIVLQSYSVMKESLKKELSMV